MAEEKKVNQADTGIVDDNEHEDYLATIQKLKENSVPRSQYDALKADNKRLLDSIVNGQSEDSSSVKQLRDPDVIRKELFGKEHNNVDYMTLTLELRDSLIERGEPDPFLPYGSRITPTADDIAEAEKCATVYRECLEYAEGDNDAFTNELMRRTSKGTIIRK